MGLGQQSKGKGDLPEAKFHLSNARATIAQEDSLADLPVFIQRLLVEVDRQLDARKAYDHFKQHRHDALFQETRFTGGSRADNREATRKAVRAALEQFGILPDAAVLHTLSDGVFSPEQRH